MAKEEREDKDRIRARSIGIPAFITFSLINGLEFLNLGRKPKIHKCRPVERYLG